MALEARWLLRDECARLLFSGARLPATQQRLDAIQRRVIRNAGGRGVQNR
jgi:hypothetical protein